MIIVFVHFMTMNYIIKYKQFYKFNTLTHNITMYENVIFKYSQ